MSTRPRSLVLVNTGDGKGKSTAAFGVVMRAVARGWRVCVVQFVKSDKWKVGEERVARELGVDWLVGGDGFSWDSTDLDQSARRARAAWQEAAAAIAARPAQVNIVATGRAAPPALIDLADTVTEMVKVKHAFDRGIRARRGIDF